jgi:hypothetical protein
VSPPRPTLCALACAALGCAAGPVTTTQASVDSGLKVAAVVLEPVQATGMADTTALSQRLTAVTLQAVSGEALVWAGTEIQVLHPERRDWSANSAVPLLRAADIPLEQALVVKARVDTGQASSQQEVQGAAGSAVGAAAELHWRATVEILQPTTGRVLVETSALAHTDPFSGGGTDAATTQPGAVLERAAAEALGQLHGAWSPPRPPRGPVLLTWTVVPAPEGHLAHGLEAEVQRLALLQTANPGLDETEAARLARLPPGVLVREAPLGYRLRPEDLVLSVGTAPANAASLGRCRFALQGVSLEVRGPDGRLRRVNFP